jgi:RHS repeat-associated protein
MKLGTIAIPFGIFLLMLLAMKPAQSQIGIYIGEQEMDLFSEKILYANSPTQNPNPQYSGNIGAVIWRTENNDVLENTRFNYDNHNRLTEGMHFSRQQDGAYITRPEYSVPLVEYDENGNIEVLKRDLNGVQLKDNLAFTYNDFNQLSHLEELGELGIGFTSTTASAAYSYDDEGNLEYDGHKNVSYSYNENNLPDTIVFLNNNDSIIIFYDGSGIKYKKKVIYNDGQGTEHIQHYIDGIEFTDDALIAIYHDEGRTVPSGSGFKDEYAIRDHLGSPRVYFSDLDGNGEIDADAEVLQEMHYYPFGMKIDELSNVSGAENKYQFNYKEWNDDLGLNLFDYASRWYDPAIGRWNSIDPMAEKYNPWSPCNYVLNNPLKLIDPDGEDPIDVLNAAKSYLGTMYQWGGKNPLPNLIGYEFKAVDVNDGIAVSEWFRGTSWETRNEYYTTYDEKLQGCHVGLDCQGLVRLAFNADPDKIMGDIPVETAHNTMLRFERAETSNYGELHSDFSRLDVGDLVFRKNSEGTAKHVMVATGETRTDADGNVTQFEVVHAPGSGEFVQEEWISLTSSHVIGRTLRVTSSTFVQEDALDPVEVIGERARESIFLPSLPFRPVYSNQTP